jgi:hypothetical protein
MLTTRLPKSDLFFTVALDAEERGFDTVRSSTFP